MQVKVETESFAIVDNERHASRIPDVGCSVLRGSMEIGDTATARSAEGSMYSSTASPNLPPCLQQQHYADAPRS